MINSSWDEAAQEIVVKHYVNLGIAAATDRGLVVPNVKDAHTATGTFWLYAQDLVMKAGHVFLKEEDQLLL